jgi:DNA repair protein RadA/Sms
MTAAVQRLDVRVRCVACRRIQRNTRRCGLCNGTIFVAAPEYIPPAPALKLLNHVVVTSRADIPPPLLLVDEPITPLATSTSSASSSTVHKTSPTEKVTARDRVVRMSLGLAERTPVRRTATGWGDFDHVLGGGIPHHVIMLGGPRGTGKSSLMLAVCGKAAQATKRKALYCSAEGQTAPELAAMTPRELVDAGIEVVCTSSFDDIMHHAFELEPCAVVLDSLQSVHVEGIRLGSDEHARYLMELLDKLSHALDAAIVGISQMSGMGRMRGSELYQQLCDTTARVECVNEDDQPDENGTRVRLSIAGKNRGGPKNRHAYFAFDDEGALRPWEAGA